MHVLIIPSEPYERDSLCGIFQNDQACALRVAVEKIGILSFNLRSVRQLKHGIKGWPCGVHLTEEDGFRIARWHGWDSPLARWGMGSAGITRRAVRDAFLAYRKKNGRPDVIHAHNALYAGYAASTIAAEDRVPYVITEHSSLYAKGRIRPWEKRWAHKAYSGATIRSAVGSNLAALLSSEFSLPFEPFPNVLPPLFETASIPPKGEFIVSVGRLVEGKGHLRLLDAFAAAFPGGDSKLKLIGDGPLAERVREHARKLRLDGRVELLGTLKRTEVLAEMGRARFAVLASDYETFGVTIIEALALGKPVIAHRCGGPESIIRAEDGYIVERDDVHGLTSAIRVLWNSIDSFDAIEIRRSCVSRFGSGAFRERALAMYAKTIAVRRQ